MGRLRGLSLEKYNITIDMYSMCFPGVKIWMSLGRFRRKTCRNENSVILVFVVVSKIVINC